jgi:hypothetical protein
MENMKAGVLALFFMALFCGCSPRALLGPVYHEDQVDSTHAGYRKTTMTSGTAVYVNDYEEYSLVLQNPEPTRVIGRRPFGDAKVCAIEGQPTTAYIAADVGSEMPAYEVFRNAQNPPFDYRTAKFERMEYANPNGDPKTTTDAALIKDVVTTLQSGAEVTPAGYVAGNAANVNSPHPYPLFLYSESLPGLKFCAAVYVDEKGQVYLGENLNARKWVAGSAAIADWVRRAK